MDLHDDRAVRLDRGGLLILAVGLALAALLGMVIEPLPRRVYRDTMWIGERHYARGAPPGRPLPENYIERRARGPEGWVADRREWAERK